MEVDNINAAGFNKPVEEKQNIYKSNILTQDIIAKYITENDISAKLLTHVDFSEVSAIKSSINNPERTVSNTGKEARKTSSATTFKEVEYSAEYTIHRNPYCYPNSFCERFLRRSEKNQKHTNIYALTTAIGVLLFLFSCTLLLLMFYLNSQGKIPIGNKNVPEFPPHFNSMGLNGISMGGRHLVSSRDWSFVESLGNQEEIIHFTVKQATHLNDDDHHHGYLTGTIDGKSIKISGRPKFCQGSDFSAPQELDFKNIKYVHLSDMEDCHHYVFMILNKWKFPNVLGVKFERMQIQKEDFEGITKFIDRHNETLNKVEINDSYVCPSPACDIGMIDLPNHDFQVVITRRRKNPKLI